MNNRPIKKYKAGSIEAAIWENEKETDSEVLSFKTVSLSRAWKKKGENIWRRDVINLRRGDIPRIMVVLNKVHEDLLMQTDLRDAEDE